MAKSDTWTDQGIISDDTLEQRAKRLVDAQRARRAQRELAQSRTPEQRAADARCDAKLTDGQVALQLIEALDAVVTLNKVRIAEQAADLDALHVANRHLAGRLDRLALNRYLAERLDKTEARLSRALDIINEGFAALNTFYDRAIEAFPVLGKKTITEQCAAVTWRPPTKEDEG